MTRKELDQKYGKIVSKNAVYYYETDDKGGKIFRYILVGSADNAPLQVPTDGNIGIDVLPPDSVGTDEIKDGSVQLQDLSPEARAAMGDRATYDEGSEQLSFD